MAAWKGRPSRCASWSSLGQAASWAVERLLRPCRGSGRVRTPGINTVIQIKSNQMGDLCARRAALHAALVTDALVAQVPLPAVLQQAQQPHGPQQAPQHTPPTPQLPTPAAAADRVALLLREAWAVRWENRCKEALWRLSIDAARHPGNGVMRRAASPAAAAAADGSATVV
jgi:hypothetical protein